jgi:hypothetical protein
MELAAAIVKHLRQEQSLSDDPPMNLTSASSHVHESTKKRRSICPARSNLLSPISVGGLTNIKIAETRGTIVMAEIAQEPSTEKRTSILIWGVSR